MIDDLDYDSIACVDQVLYAIHAIARQELPHASAVRFVKLFSDEEAASITAMRAALMQRIVPLANGQCYAWQHYLLPIPAFEPGVFYYRHFADLAGSLAGVKDRDIIDAGAYVGDSALILQEYTAQLVYSFEAVPGHFQTLLKTLELNRCSRVIPICKALGAMPGMMSMKLNGPGSTLTTQHFSYRAERPELQVEVITLDDFAAAQHLDIGLIKTDIEGSEPDFLKGAEQTIRRCRPVLLFSMYHNHADFFGLKPLIESWNLGYRFKIAKPVESPYWDTMLICWPA